MGSGSFGEWCKAIGQNPHNTEMFQYITAFTFGLAFGAVSFGLLWLLIFLVIYEFLWILLTRAQYPYWRLYVRILVNILSIIGWCLGRWIYLGLNPFNEPFP
jgi:hypothetical protein